MMGNNEIPVKITDLTFYYNKPHGGKEDHPVLKNIFLQIPAGQRCLVVGGNGAGKSTLLRVIAGKHLISDGSAQVFGRDAFRDTTLNGIRSYVSTDWAQRTVAFSGHAVAYASDIGVSEMMVKLQQEYPERRDELLRVLRIDPNWRMHKLSDGQRSRVKLFLALIRPSKIIVLDEVLGLMDLVARQDFLQYLVKESQVNKTTILLATNIFDGLSDWTTHLVYVREAAVRLYAPIDQVDELNALKKKGVSEPLMRVVETWLRQEIEEKEQRHENLAEPECGKLAASATDVESLKSAGGYANGRLADLDL